MNLKTLKERRHKTKIDSLSIALATRLSRQCGIDQKVIFHGSIPMIVPKTTLDRFCDKIRNMLRVK